jgi:hypothetical protein
MGEQAVDVLSAFVSPRWRGFEIGGDPRTEPEDIW